MRLLATALFACAASIAARRAGAATIHVSPGDSFSKIEAAKAGDEVVIAPGTYAFRVHLTAKGTATQRIVIRAQDPNDPPTWDLGTTLVENAPGSYTGGDRGRACWQLDGAEYVTISGIHFTNCHNAGRNAAGLRYYGGSKGIVITDSVFRGNDNGLTGGSEGSEATVEHCELGGNGNLAASAPTHNIYIYGGTFALRYSYVHDPIQGQNFHIRARASSLDYNWFARARTYEGDLMSDDDEPAGPSTQEMIFRGNVVVQGNPTNKSQIIALFNDNELEQLTLKLRMIHNTVVAAFPSSAVVHLSNEDGTKMSVEMSNNVLSGGKPMEIDDPTAGTVGGTANWLLANTPPGSLTGTVFGPTPPFKDAGAKDFTLAPGAAAIGAASASVMGLPDREYFKDESITRKFRVRASAKDIGAFESTTTGDSFGPGDAPPAGGPGPVGTSSSGDLGPGDGGASNGGAGSGASADEGGCGCRMVRAGGLGYAGIAAAGVAALLGVRRRRRSR